MSQLMFPCLATGDLLHLPKDHLTLSMGFNCLLSHYDRATCQHAERTAKLIKTFADWLGYSSEQIEQLKCGALLHDIGKTQLPNEILNKPGKLSDSEWKMMKRHPIEGINLIRRYHLSATVKNIVKYHHERWDGNGYPDRLCGDAIPKEARLMAVIDVWDALTSERSYRSSWQPDEVRKFLKNEAGAQFDPKIVSAFTDWVKSHNPLDQTNPWKSLLGTQRLIMLTRRCMNTTSGYSQFQAAAAPR